MFYIIKKATPNVFHLKSPVFPDEENMLSGLIKANKVLILN